MENKITDTATYISQDLKSILSSFEIISTDIVQENARRVDQDGTWPAESLRALQSSGLGGLVISSEHGGLGHGLFALARACEILGAACPSTAICYGMHCVGSSVIAAQASEFQIKKYLQPIAAGRHFTTLALSEAGTGAHFYYPQTRLIPTNDNNFKVQGEKHFVTNGGHADSYVVSVLQEEPEGIPRFSCVVLENGHDGMRWGEPWQGFGMRGNESRNLQIKDVEISGDELLGSVGDQIWYVFNVVAPYFLIAMAGTYLGLATSALELARTHLVNRQYAHDSRKLADTPVLQNRFGAMWGKLEAARRLVYSAATRFDAGDEDAVPAVLIAKAEVSDIAVQLANEAMTMMGGIGYQEGEQIQKILRDARAAHVMAPTTDLLRTWTGRLLLGQSILGE